MVSKREQEELDRQEREAAAIQAEKEALGRGGAAAILAKRAARERGQGEKVVLKDKFGRTAEEASAAMQKANEQKHRQRKLTAKQRRKFGGVLAATAGVDFMEKLAGTVAPKAKAPTRADRAMMEHDMFEWLMEMGQKQAAKEPFDDIEAYDSFKCPVCEGFLEEPTSFPEMCRHMLCKECMIEAYEDPENTEMECPQCNVQMNAKFRKNWKEKLRPVPFMDQAMAAVAAGPREKVKLRQELHAESKTESNLYSSEIGNRIKIQAEQVRHFETAVIDAVIEGGRREVNYTYWLTQSRNTDIARNQCKRALKRAEKRAQFAHDDQLSNTPLRFDNSKDTVDPLRIEAEQMRRQAFDYLCEAERMHEETMKSFNEIADVHKHSQADIEQAENALKAARDEWSKLLSHAEEVQKEVRARMDTEHAAKLGVVVVRTTKAGEQLMYPTDVIMKEPILPPPKAEKRLFSEGEVVKGVDMLQRMLAMCDRVIHVPRQFPTIMEAVANAEEGTKIVIHPGVYHENVSISRSLNIEGYTGDPKDVVIEIDTPGKVALTLLGVLARVADLTLRNVVTRKAGPVVENTCGQLVLENVVIRGGAQGLFSSKARATTVMRKCLIEDVIQNGVMATGGCKILSHFSEFRRCGHHGFLLSSEGTHAILERNKVHSCQRNAMNLKDGASMSTFENEFRHCVGAVVATDPGTNVEMREDTLSHCSSNGIQLVTGAAAKLSDCSLCWNKGHGAVSRGPGSQLEIVKSQCHGNTKCGVDVLGGAISLLRSTKIIRNGRDGVLIQNTNSETTLDSCVVQENSRHAVNCAANPIVIIRFCKLDNSIANALNVVGADDDEVLMDKNNQRRHVPIACTNCYFNNSTGFGIHVTGGGRPILLEKSDVRSCLGGGVSLSGGSIMVMRKCKILDNNQHGVVVDGHLTKLQMNQVDVLFSTKHGVVVANGGLCQADNCDVKWNAQGNEKGRLTSASKPESKNRGASVASNKDAAPRPDSNASAGGGGGGGSRFPSGGSTLREATTPSRTTRQLPPVKES